MNTDRQTIPALPFRKKEKAQTSGANQIEIALDGVRDEVEDVQNIVRTAGTALDGWYVGDKPGLSRLLQLHLAEKWLTEEQKIAAMKRASVLSRGPWERDKGLWRAPLAVPGWSVLLHGV